MSSPRASLVFAFAGGLSIALACGNGGPSDLNLRSSYSGESGTPADPYGDLEQGYTVPPDRAVLRVDVIVEAGDRATAAAQLRTHINAVVTASSDTCAATVLDYTPPSAPQWKSWRGTAELRVDISLAGLDTVVARMDALDACDAALATVLTPEGGVTQDNPEVTAWVVRSAQPVLLVDTLPQHAPALLARHAARLAAVADGGAAPQLHPEDLRCTATGEVQYGSGHRRLSGVPLSLGMDCRIVTPEIQVHTQDKALAAAM